MKSHEIISAERLEPSAAPTISFPFELGPFGMASLLYDTLRASTPVFRARVPSGWSVWVATRYVDICTVHRDPRFSRGEAVRLRAELIKGESMEVAPGALQNVDGRAQAEMRKVFASHFSQSHSSDWAEAIRKETDRILDGLRDKKSFDLRSDFFMPLMQQTAQEIFGAPFGQDSLVEGFFDAKAIATLRTRILFLLKEGSPPGTLIANLQPAFRQGLMTQEALMDNLIALIMVTFEAIAAPFLGGVFALLRERQQWEDCVADLSLIPNMIEETLRCFPNVDGQLLRIATEDIFLSGVEVKRGEAIMAPVAAANMDPEVFHEPRRFNIHRANNSKQIGFGVGRHHCLGWAVAKVWMETVLKTLLRRMPSLCLAADPNTIRYKRETLVIVLEHLPVAW